MTNDPADDSSPPQPTVSSAGGRFKTAAEMAEPEDSIAATGYRAPIMFAVGFALLLLGTIFLIDHRGPTTEVSARVTGTDTRDPRRGAVEYFVEGVDADGGEFEMKVAESTYDLVRSGDEVTITRAWLTNRAIRIDGPSYRVVEGASGSWFEWFVIVVALLIILWSVRALRRESDGEPATQPWRRVRWWIPILLACALGWIVFERIQASAADSAPTWASGTFAPAGASLADDH